MQAIQWGVFWRSTPERLEIGNQAERHVTGRRNRER
jgi:hypothetical protein